MYKIGILFLCFALIGCNNDSKGSSIFGSWVTDTCQQLTNPNGQPVDVWAKSTYTFDINSDIYMVSNSYSDSDCITSSDAIEEAPLLVATFIEQGEVTTSSGIGANAIAITFSTAAPHAVTTSGFYRINNKQLCLS